MASTGETIGARFDTQPNALNFLRLCLALEVVVWHSYALRGATWLPEWAHRLLGDIAVDGFFAISGFLITGAWCRRPQLGRFLAARARRILPGLWACLLVTAFAIAPAAMWLSGGGALSEVGRWGYVLNNATLIMRQPGIDGGPGGVALAGTWNGALWSLWFEVVCYVLVAVLGVCRLVRLPVAAGLLAAVWYLMLSTDGAPLMTRTLLLFLCGMVLYLTRDRVPSSSRLAAAAAVVFAVGVAVLPDYRMVAAPAIAYLCIYGGITLGRFPRLRLRNDLSYGTYVYGFPVQQALLLCGVSLSWLAFAAVSMAAVLPVAALSWFLVERPATRFRLSSRSRRPVAALPVVSVAAGRSA